MEYGVAARGGRPRRGEFGFGVRRWGIGGERVYGNGGIRICAYVCGAAGKGGQR